MSCNDFITSQSSLYSQTVIKEGIVHSQPDAASNLRGALRWSHTDTPIMYALIILTALFMRPLHASSAYFILFKCIVNSVMTWASNQIYV